MTTVKGTLNVDQAVTLDSTLDVTGDTSVSTFDSTGATSIATTEGAVNIASIGQTTTVKGAFDVSGASQLQGLHVATTLDVSGATVIYNTLNVSEDATINGLTVGKGKGSINTNTAIGTNTLLNNNTTGSAWYNTAIGFWSLYDNTSGKENTATGMHSLRFNKTGNHNTAFGSYSLKQNIDGDYNTALGYNAGNINILGINNTYIGSNANANTGLTELSNSTAIGYNAKVDVSNQIMLGTSNETVVIPGDASFNSDLKVGGDITVLGALDLDGDVSLNSKLFVANDISVNSISIGIGGGDISTNTVVGNNSMQANTTGSNNTSFGFNANTLLNGGNENTAIGSLALSTAVDANKNTAVGYNALSGSNSTQSTTNTAIGANAGSNNSLGNSLTFLGADTGIDLTTNTYEKSTAIGAGAIITASNQIVLGPSPAAAGSTIHLNAASITGPHECIDVSMINFKDESIPASAIVGSSSETTALTGATTIENTLTVDDLATFKHNLSVVGGLAVGQDSTIDGDLLISGDTTIVGNMSVPQINDMLTFVTYSDVYIASGLQDATTDLSTDWNNVDTAITGVPAGQWLGGVLSETGQYQMFYNQAEPTKVYRSTNYGTSFEQKTLSGSIYDAGYSANMNNLMAMDYTGKFSVFAGNDIVEYSINSGLTFNNIAIPALNSQAGTKISAVAMSGNGKTLIVGGTNSQLFVSTDSGSLVSIDASPIYGTTNFHNWKSISCNGAGFYCMAITDSLLYITNPGADTLYNGIWVDKTATIHAEMNLANVTDSFINNDGNLFGITTTNGLYLSTDFGASWTKHAQANGYTSITYTYTRTPNIDGEYIYLTTADTGTVKKVINVTGGVSVTDALGTNAASAAHTSVIVSGHGGYTYAFTGATESYTPYIQVNTGDQTVSVPSGTAFVLNKDAELNMKLDVSDNVIFNKNLYLDGDASFNSNIDISGQVAIGKNTANVSLDISGNDAIRLPVGDDTQRPIKNDNGVFKDPDDNDISAKKDDYIGSIRYNSANSQFEGFGPGDNWGSLGGVINVAQNTKITASSPNPDSSNNELQFYTAPVAQPETAGIERMRIKADGDISMNHNLVVGGDVDVKGVIDVKGDIKQNGNAIGLNNLSDVTSFDSNIGIGTNALNLNTGDFNTAVGKGALALTGGSSTGQSNTAIGYDSGYGATGSNCTFLGTEATASPASIDNSTAIGYQAIATASNQIMLGAAAQEVVIPGFSLNIDGQVNIGNSLKITNTTNNVTLDVTNNGDITMTGELDVSGNVNFRNEVDCKGSTYLASDGGTVEINTSGNLTTVKGGFGVNEDSTFGDSNLAATITNQGLVTLNNTAATTNLTNGCLVAKGGVAISGALRVGGAANISNNLTVGGNLTVNGTTTTINTANLDISDNVIMLSKGTTTATSDAGILIERGGSVDNAFMGWVNGNQRFIMGTTDKDSTATGDLNVSKAQLEVDLLGDVITTTQNNIETMTGLNAIGKADTNTTFSGPIVAVKGATFTNNEIIDFSAARPQGIWNGSVKTNDGGTLVLDVTSDTHSGPILNADLNGTVTTVAQNSITTMTGLTAVGTAGTTTTFSGPIAIEANQTITTTSGNLIVDPATHILEIKGDGEGVDGQIQLNCYNNNHGQILKSQPHSVGVTNAMMLPKGGNSTLVSEIAEQTLTNKTLASPTITGTGTIEGTFSGNVTGDLYGVIRDPNGNVVLDNGSINSTPNFGGNVSGNLDGIVGGTTPAAGTFTEITSQGNVTMFGKFIKQF
jgi:predicted acyltransferase (DUF342 family)